ncbi:hypothetical protein JOC94_004536 [Bacillus thermophilus]|uniref:Uncharacterized protein n=1 Tax=Siminovitchia thermophila TaxID=1245522 RepID=A0ABS2RCX5_9BACI|nr:hypothetical protein [Siminovitchia thermophila]
MYHFGGESARKTHRTLYRLNGTCLMKGTEERSSITETAAVITILLSKVEKRSTHKYNV